MPILVPACCIGKLRRSFRPESDRPPHSLRRSATRSRTVAQSSVAASPDRTRAARRSSSDAQTAPRVAGSSTAGESRLASSWAARSARSSSRRARASRRIVSVSEVTTPIVRAAGAKARAASQVRRGRTDNVSSQSRAGSDSGAGATTRSPCTAGHTFRYSTVPPSGSRPGSATRCRTASRWMGRYTVERVIPNRSPSSATLCSPARCSATRWASWRTLSLGCCPGDGPSPSPPSCLHGCACG